ncbi:MAG: hypothetical protein QW756_04010, partial [Nitrososphaerota archaeon]
IAERLVGNPHPCQKPLQHYSRLIETLHLADRILLNPGSLSTHLQTDTWLLSMKGLRALEADLKLRPRKTR